MLDYHMNHCEEDLYTAYQRETVFRIKDCRRIHITVLHKKTPQA